MDIATFVTTAKALPPEISVLVRGPHGIGKSQVVRQVARHFNLQVIDRRLSQMTEGDMVGLHVRNFVDAIRGDAKANAPIEEGHKSTRLCHLGNLAYRTGKTLKFDATAETTDAPEANKLLGREYRKGFELPAV